MQDLVEALYLYAQENLMGRCLQSWEYRQTVRGAEEDREAFRSTLTEEQNQKLETLLSQEREIGLLEDEALLLAGISIGLELGRL